jgi:hypothetical protein
MSDQSDDQAVQTVEVVDRPDLPGARWRPREGAEATALLRQLADVPEPDREQLRRESLSIMSSCTPPTLPDETEIGLVFGHIQSGKTMSFTDVAALARDNGFPLVIVVTGTSVPLSTQSRDRIQRDLRLQTRPDRPWWHLHNPGRSDAPALAGKLADWRDPDVPPAARRTVLITVMKNHSRLRNLVAALRDLDVRGVPALVIDDEGDQAGLNNLVNQGRESTTHARLRELRAALPHHTYLQYTATPQAPLLINLIDALSPRFAEVLTPGTDYVGGREFFHEHDDLVRDIPASHIITPTNQLHEPPPSLLEAMRIFFLGVAAGIVETGGEGNRSMMIHPSQQTRLHADYARWVREVANSWQRMLGLPENDPDRRELLEEFHEAYRDLSRTVPDLPAVEELFRVLNQAVRSTLITEVNAVRGRTPQVDWRGNYSHILVGGQAMDRGFTVEGLTVTYMPRGVGTRTADTIQQRARFFGYKRSYLGYCRVYLEAAARGAYVGYVDHEEDIRARLVAHRRTGRPLVDFRRAFFLDPALRPTRKSVLDLDCLQTVISDEWFRPDAPHDSEDAFVSNRQVVAEFTAGVAFRSDEEHPARRHEFADVPLRDAYERLLVRLRFTRAADSQRFTGLMLQVKEYLDSHPDATCRIYRMNGGNMRQRSLTSADEVDQLFEGPGAMYPGDRAIRSPEGMTIQLHSLGLARTARGQVVLPDVPTIAAWLPSEMARGTLVQDEP